MADVGMDSGKELDPFLYSMASSTAEQFYFQSQQLRRWCLLVVNCSLLASFYFYNKVNEISHTEWWETVALGVALFLLNLEKENIMEIMTF